jgi:hypothetical protein
MDIWILCWKLNLEFQTKLSSLHKCIVCGSDVKGGPYVSNFVSDAVFCGQHHRWDSFGKDAAHSRKCICTTCDEDLLMSITMRKQKCFAEGCESVLNIDKGVVREKVADEELIEKYVKFVEDVCVYLFNT